MVIYTVYLVGMLENDDQRHVKVDATVRFHASVFLSHLHDCAMDTRQYHRRVSFRR
jgi:hypothetical protein